MVVLVVLPDPGAEAGVVRTIGAIPKSNIILSVKCPAVTLEDVDFIESIILLG